MIDMQRHIEFLSMLPLGSGEGGGRGMGNVLSLHAQNCHFGMIDMQNLPQSRTHSKENGQHAFAWDLGKTVTAS